MLSMRPVMAPSLLAQGSGPRVIDAAFIRERIVGSRLLREGVTQGGAFRLAGFAQDFKPSHASRFESFARTWPAGVDPQQPMRLPDICGDLLTGKTFVQNILWRSLSARCQEFFAFLENPVGDMPVVVAMTAATPLPTVPAAVRPSASSSRPVGDRRGHLFYQEAMIRARVRMLAPLTVEELTRFYALVSHGRLRVADYRPEPWFEKIGDFFDGGDRLSLVSRLAIQTAYRERCVRRRV